MKTGGLRTAGRLTVTLLAVAGLTLVGGASGAAPAQSGQPSIRVAWGWTEPNGDKNNTRHVLGPINSHNVGRLSVAWTVPIKAPSPPDRWPGTYATTPVVVDGIVYTQDLDSNVYAIELRTGRVLWTTMYNSPINGPNGVNVEGGRVFGATTSNAFALDARTGKELWSRKLTRNANEGIDMTPGVNNGTMYIAVGPGNADAFFKGDGEGTLWALDVATGTPKWEFHNVPTDLWGNTALNSGGGMWYPPTFAPNGDLYVSVANPAPFIGTPQYPWGSSRPGPDLYTDSLVKLDHRNGNVIWYNQVLPHDIYDWDLQNSPVQAVAGDRPVVIGSGKAGYVFQFDPTTGKLLWKTSVGIHNGHDHDNLLAMSGQFSKLPAFPYQVFPGALGGVISPIAVDGTTIYAAVNNLPVTWVNQTDPVFPSFDSGTGDMVALDLVTGRIKWQTPLPSSAYGAASVVNDVVFTTTYDGTIRAFNTRTGKAVWQAKLPAHSNAPVAINGNYVLAGGGWPQSPNEKAEIVAYRLGD